MSKPVKWAAMALAGTVAILALLLLWPVSHAPIPATSGGRLVENVRIVDVVSGTVSQPQAIAIRDGTIVAIGSDAQSMNLPRFDGGGSYALPAFWDMHVHSFQTSPQMHFPLWVANGVLNVRDMMDCPGTADSLVACAADKRRWNRQARAGTLVAPRFVELASFYLADSAMTPDQAKVAVRQARERGLDAVKVYNDLSLPAYRAAAAEADALGLRLVGHLPRSVALDTAVAAGQDSFEHAHLLPRHCFAQADRWRKGELADQAPTALILQIVAQFDAGNCDAAIAQMAEAGAWLVPTHVTREEDARAGDEAFLDDPRLIYLDPLSRWARGDDLSAVRSAYPDDEGQAALEAYFRHGLRLTKRAKDGGVGLLVGTDTALGGFRYHDELAHLSAAGLSNLDVLRAATIEAARYVGEDEIAGSIEPGKRAQIVLVAGDPLVDIANSRRIRAVVDGGRIYDRAALDRLLDFTRGQAAAPHNWIKLVWGFARSSMASEM